MTLRPEDEKEIARLRAALAEYARSPDEIEGVADLVRHAQEMIDMADLLLDGPVPREMVEMTMRPVPEHTWPPSFSEWDKAKAETAHLPPVTDDEKIVQLGRRLDVLETRREMAEMEGDQVKLRGILHTIETHTREFKRLAQAKE